MLHLTVYAPYLGGLGIVIAFLIFAYVKSQPNGNERMQELEEMIHAGAMVFLKREYTILFFFAAAVFVLLGIGINWETSIAYASGAVCSMLAGYFGMSAATRGNSRTAEAANKHGQAKALNISYLSGSVMGLVRGQPGSFGRRHFLFHLWEGSRHGEHHQRLRHGRQLHRPVRPHGRRHLHQGR